MEAEPKGYKGLHRNAMPLSERLRIWIYTFPTHDAVRIAVFAVITFAATLLVLAMMSGCRRQKGCVNSTGHAYTCGVAPYSAMR